jgi:hypothetical protein
VRVECLGERAVSTVCTGTCVRLQRVTRPPAERIDGWGAGLYTSLPFVRPCRGRTGGGTASYDVRGSGGMATSA